MRDQLVQPVGAHHPRLHRLAARRAAGDARDIHVAIGGQRQGARDRRRRHHQHVGRPCPCPAAACADARRSGAARPPPPGPDRGTRHLPRTAHGCRSGCRSRPPPALPGSSRAARAFLAPGQSGQPHAGRLGIGLQRRQMLAHQKFGRRHQRRPAGPLPPRPAWPAAPQWSCRSRHRPAAAAACAFRSPCLLRFRPAPAAADRSGQRAGRRWPWLSAGRRR